MSKISDLPDEHASIFTALIDLLQPLDEIEAGLAKRAADFVWTGDGEAVLLTLGQHKAKMTSLFGLDNYATVGPKWSELQAVVDNKEFWDPAVILRVGRVFATTEIPLAYLQCGTKTAPLWLRRLLIMTVRAKSGGWYDRQRLRKPFGGFDVERCRELLRLAGQPDDGLLDILFHESDFDDRQDTVIDKLPGVQQFLETEPEAVVAASARLDTIGRAEVVRTVGRFGYVDAYLGFVFGQATGSAKSAREAALAALHDADAEALLAQAARVFETGSSAARAQAATLIASALREQAVPALQAQLEKEKGKRVRETLEAALATLSLATDSAGLADDAKSDSGSGGFQALDDTFVAVPPVPPMPESGAIPQSVFAKL